MIERVTKTVFSDINTSIGYATASITGNASSWGLWPRKMRVNLSLQERMLTDMTITRSICSSEKQALSVTSS